MLKDRRLEMLRLADCALHTEDGHTFPAHKSILAIKSEYFSSIFRSSGVGNTGVPLRGIKGDILCSILSYIYNGKLHVTEENFSGLLVASHILLLPDILSKTKKVLERNLTFNNCFAVLTAASSINDVDVARRSFRFIELHFERIIRESNKFHEVPLQKLMLFLKDRNLRVSNEYTVWLAIRDWVEANLPTRLPLVQDLLKCLAIGEVNEHLGNEILNHDIVSRNEFCSNISDIKSLNSNFNSSQLLRNFILSDSEINRFSHTYRNPPALHFFSYFYGVEPFFCGIYVTYDENIDLWRKVLEVQDPSAVFFLNGSIYIFTYFDLSRYSVADEEWYPCTNYAHIGYQLATLGRLIYVLGGRQLPERYTVAFYDPEVDGWYGTSPMFPIKWFKTAVLGDCIYIVGYKPNSDSEVIAQVYDARTQVWSHIPAPSIVKHFQCLAAYHGKIYIVGSKIKTTLETVEVFDPSRNIWYAVEDLPYTYVHSIADEYIVKVINDCLIVSGQHPIGCERGHLYSTVMWNEDGQCWKILEGPSPKCKLCYYSLYTLEDSGQVNIISKKNKDHRTVFEKTTFEDIYL